MPEQRDLVFPPGSLVLVAGLPGAGKSTLLRRLYGLTDTETEPVPAGGAVVIDSTQARNWWSPYLRPLPPRGRIPFVYATHVWRIGKALTDGRSVVAHTRGTWPHLLYGFGWLARRSGAGLHLVLLDVPPALARAGQHERGRVLTGPVFARHVRRWRKLVRRAHAGSLPPVASVTVLHREDADQVRDIKFG
ncbi:AAA family ATPase [Actinocorallia populi]|uniref:AAA family ATPase n=1 Tax=Actinocorallia populi TaxID=2079200 RepID=UPI000D09025E|nr:AAA family ATPase [Actinocorallia populi]